MKSSVRYCYYWVRFSLGRKEWDGLERFQTKQGTCGQACGDLRPAVRLHSPREMAFPGAGRSFPVCGPRSTEGCLWHCWGWASYLLCTPLPPSLSLKLAGLELGSGLNSQITCLCLPGGGMKGMCAWPLKEKFFKVHSLVILIDFCDFS